MLCFINSLLSIRIKQFRVCRRLVSHPVQNCRDLLRFFYHRSMLLVWRDFLGVAVTVITPAVTQFGSNACLRS